MHPSRVLLAEDHPSLAAAIGEYVAGAFQLVGTVRDDGALLEAATLNLTLLWLTFRCQEPMDLDSF